MIRFKWFLGIFCLILSGTALGANALGPPAPVPYKSIADPPDDAERHIVVRAQDRGPVWLYTGFLNHLVPDMELSLIERVKPHHWRADFWPFWYPCSVTVNPAPQWGDMRDSPEAIGKCLEKILRLREQGMTFQCVLHHKGRYYGRWRITADMLDDFYEHIYTLVRYCRVMGAPIDYYEICNEPGVGPYEGIKGYGFQGTWEEFLAMWDTAYQAIRDAYPEAKIVGPSYGCVTAGAMKPFLDHCHKQGQRLDVLSWHEISQKCNARTFHVEPDKAYKNIMQIRRLVAEQYPDLGIKEIHIDEWGETVEHTGPGTQIAYFYYFDQAGVDRAAKAHWTQDDLDGILVSPQTPRTSYWCWAEYAKQEGGLRLVTQTNDRCVVALASRHEAPEEVRVLVARSKRYTGEQFTRKLPPCSVRVDVEGIPITGSAEVTILRLGPEDGPLWEDQLAQLTTRQVKEVTDGVLSLVIDKLAENQVVSLRFAPSGTWAKEAQAAAQAQAQQQASRGIAQGVPLPYVLLREGFEEGFNEGETILGKHGWTHARNQTSALHVFQDATTAHEGSYYAQFTENYWATNDCFHEIPEQNEGVMEVTAWYRFPDYEGNRNGKGFGAMLVGLCETPDRQVDRNYVTFKFGTNEQNGYSVVIFNNEGIRRINWTDASGLRQDVRGKWYQVSLVLDMEAKRLTARYRSSTKDPWIVFHTARYQKMDWIPKYVLISAYNQAPDWRFCVDDVMVTSSIAPQPVRE